MNEKKRLFMIIFSGVIIFILLYHFPLQRYLAEKQYIEYLKIQGIDSDNILSEKYIKDYKQGGYYIQTKYKDDLNHLYDYHYLFYTANGFNTITCIIYDNNNNEVTDFSNTTYKPID